jgi:serine/threonine-protein kinase
MGEVWKARDTRLDRIVALKVSKEQFSERFEREARAVAALNHQHICQLYDVGPDYVVLEFIEGTPAAGPMPVSKAVEYASQILDALDAAHRKGITHRDLKPANILITKQGVKLLDFGLAKRSGPLQQTDVTLTEALTSRGQIVGTLQYMAPEQLQGRETDARSDLFAFGCVLYEMLTGKRAFDDQNAASVIAAILEREPAPLNTAAPLYRVIRRCLAKDPDQRFQTARDLKTALGWAMEQPPAMSSAAGSRYLPWALAAILLAITVWALLRSAPETSVHAAWLTLSFPGSSALTNDHSLGFFALSPDGERIVYVGARGSVGSQLFLRGLDQPDPVPLPRTEGASAPFFSPDGQSVAFFAQGKLRKIAIGGSSPMDLTDCPGGSRGGWWGTDGKIVFAWLGSGILEVSENGGAARSLTTIDPQSPTIDRWPQSLPGGKAVLFTGGSYPDSRIEAVLQPRGERRVLVPGGNRGRFVPSTAGSTRGHLVYEQDATLFAAPFDAGSLTITGKTAKVLEGLQNNVTTSHWAHFEPSQGGVLVYLPASARDAERRLVWVDRQGDPTVLAADRAGFENAKLSPDGGRLAVNIVQGGMSSVWVYDLTRGSRIRLTSEGTNHQIIWSPDGKQIIYGHGGRGPVSLFRRMADGTGTDERLNTSPGVVDLPTSWSPDGRFVAFTESGPSGTHVRILPMEGERKPYYLFQTRDNQGQASFSPDGHWLAYSSDETGRNEVYVQPFVDNTPASGKRFPISAGSGEWPLWSHDGRELFYREGDRMMVADVSLHPTFSASAPRFLFDKHFLIGPVNTSTYDVSGDGKRFVMIETDELAQPLQLNVILNWTADLRRRLLSQ